MSTIEIVPIDLLLLIFSFIIRARDINSLARCCKSWRDLIYNRYKGTVNVSGILLSALSDGKIKSKLLRLSSVNVDTINEDLIKRFDCGNVSSPEMLKKVISLDHSNVRSLNFECSKYYDIMISMSLKDKFDITLNKHSDEVVMRYMPYLPQGYLNKDTIKRVGEILLPISQFMCVRRVIMDINIVFLMFEFFIHIVGGPSQSHRLVEIIINNDYDKEELYQLCTMCIFHNIWKAVDTFVWNLSVCKVNRGLILSVFSYITGEKKTKLVSTQYIKVYVTKEERERIIKENKLAILYEDDKIFDLAVSSYKSGEKAVCHLLLVDIIV